MICVHSSFLIRGDGCVCDARAFYVETLGPDVYEVSRCSHNCSTEEPALFETSDHRNCISKCPDNQYADYSIRLCQETCGPNSINVSANGLPSDACQCYTHSYRLENAFEAKDHRCHVPGIDCLKVRDGMCVQSCGNGMVVSKNNFSCIPSCETEYKRFYYEKINGDNYCRPQIWIWVRLAIYIVLGLVFLVGVVGELIVCRIQHEKEPSMEAIYSRDPRSAGKVLGYKRAY